MEDDDLNGVGEKFDTVLYMVQNNFILAKMRCLKKR